MTLQPFLSWWPQSDSYRGLAGTKTAAVRDVCLASRPHSWLQLFSIGHYLQNLFTNFFDTSHCYRDLWPFLPLPVTLTLAVDHNSSWKLWSMYSHCFQLTMTFDMLRKSFSLKIFQYFILWKHNCCSNDLVKNSVFRSSWADLLSVSNIWVCVMNGVFLSLSDWPSVGRPVLCVKKTSQSSAHKLFNQTFVHLPCLGTHWISTIPYYFEWPWPWPRSAGCHIAWSLFDWWWGLVKCIISHVNLFILLKPWHYLQTIQPNSLTPAIVVSTVDLFHFIKLSVSLLEEC